MEPRKWLILSTVSLGMFMATLDISIVNVSLPRIQASLGVDLPTVEWVIVAYLLVVGSVLLPFGRLGEVLTFRRVYLVGFVVFTLASLGCGAAPNAGVLIGFRVVQAIGGGMIQAMAPAIIGRTFGPGERGRALGVNAMSVAMGLSLGPAIGGVLTDLASWRAIFLVNLPIGLVAITWAARILPRERSGQGQTFDAPGAVLAAGTLCALLLVLVDGETWGWTSPLALGLMAVVVVAAVGFVIRERACPQPLIDLALFRSRAFSAGLASVGIAMAGLYTATFLLPFLLENSLGYSALTTGLLTMPIPVAMGVVAPFSGVVGDRFGPRLPSSLGLAVMAVGLLSVSWLPNPFTAVDLLVRECLIGVGIGLFMSPNGSAVLGAVPRERIGTASGTFAQMRVVGQSLGIALSGAVVAVRLVAHTATLDGALAGSGRSTAQAAGAVHAAALGLAIRDALFVAVILSCIGVLTSLVRGTEGAVERGTEARAKRKTQEPGRT